MGGAIPLSRVLAAIRFLDHYPETTFLSVLAATSNRE